MTDNKKYRALLLCKCLLVTPVGVALTGMGPAANAEVRPSEKHVGVRISNYEESAISAGSVLSSSGGTDRNAIDVSQVYVQLPISSTMSIESNMVIEKSSGVFDRYVQPADSSLNSEGLPTNADPKVVMSEASIEDTRTEVSVTTHYFFDQGSLSGTVGISDEDDYLSVFTGLDAAIDFNEKHSTFNAGIGVTSDKITPVQSDAASQVSSEKKGSFTAFAGISQVLDRNSTLQTTLSVTQEQGFLSDPYKQVFKYDNGAAIQIADSRPDARTAVAWMLSYRHHMPSYNGTLRIDYRLYDDNWGVTSHTVDIGWHHFLLNNWQVIPGIRYYSQSEADFYDPYFLVDREDDHYTSDYRLSPYGAISARLKVIKDLQNWRLSFLFENYASDKDLGLGNVNIEHPALVDYTYVTLGLDYKF